MPPEGFILVYKTDGKITGSTGCRGGTKMTPALTKKGAEEYKDYYIKEHKPESNVELCVSSIGEVPYTEDWQPPTS